MVVSVILEQPIVFIPELLDSWPLPRAVNPSYEEVKASSSAWFRQHNLFPDEKRLRKQESYDFTKLAASICASADASFLRLAADYLNCIFWWDDYTEDVPAHVTQQMAKAIIGGMRSGQATMDQKLLGVELHTDFWKRVVPTLSPSLEGQEHFLGFYDSYCHSVFEEAVDREREIIRDVPSYFALRRHTVAVRPALALLALAVDLPPWVLKCEWVKQAEECCLDMVIIGNDVYSWNVEQARGLADHNLVTILMSKYSLKVQEAMNHCAVLHQDVVDRFLAIRDSILPLTCDETMWDELTRQKVAHYIDGLAETVRGCDMWSAESVRYGLSEEFTKTRMVKIRPSKSL
ncbi:isoprenoid synthase domain-containing protein [Coprinopsis sp. MPI-PUGE-AT-0042]|nr:isoprenoid synthase domain-containing protein [Coprinopsis sp. MPI-PUGE-AT-0042]